ncbi:PKD domain-containing protein, partial [Bacteroidota bacterium]
DYPFTVTLIAESAEGCTSTTSDTVTVYSYIEADFDIDVSEGCSPFTVNISNNSSGTEYYWFWNDSDLTLGNADSNSGAATIPVIYTNTAGGTRTDSLTLIIDNGYGCYDTLKRAIDIHSAIDAQFTFSQPDSCNESDVQFTNSTAYASNYKWNFGDGTSLETSNLTVNKTFTNNEIDDSYFKVLLTAESIEGCTDTISDIVTVYSKLIAGMSIPNSQDCPPFNSTIINTSTGNAANTYRWYVDGTEEFSSTGLADFAYTYDNTNPAIRNYTVRMESTNSHGCSDDTIATITVYEYVDAQFAIDDNDGCTPHTATFDNQTIAPATNTNYFWSFGDATSSSVFEPTHDFINSSRTTDRTFRIHLTATTENYCTDTISYTITSYHQPLASLYVSETSSCPPLDVTMNNFNSKGFDSFEWRFGDGNTDNTQDTRAYSYPNTTDNIINYTLKLWVSTNQGCTHMDSTTLNVFPAVLADFTIDDDDGCSAHVAEFMNSSSSPATQFYWNFDDGSFENKDTVFHRFVNNTYVDEIFNVRLTATSDYNCWDDTVQPVTVYAQPKALFNPTPTVQIFPESTVWLNSTSNNQTWDYLWEFNDQDNTTSTSSNETFFDYPHWGEKRIRLTLNSQTSSCMDTLSKLIVIYPPPVNADFTSNIDGGCLDDGLEVQFTAAGSVYNEEYDYSWDFGDGNTGSGQDVAHTYTSAGVYYVKMTASSQQPGAGEDYEYKTIRVYSNPIAAFEVIPNVSMIDAATLEARVEFFNQSICNDTAGCAFVWDFGDGNTSFATNVTHYYEKPPDDEIPKEYDIQLKVTNSVGCVDSLLKEREVKIIGEGAIAFPNAFTPNDDGLNDTFIPVYKGVIQYEMLVYNRWGELIFKTNDLSVGWDGKLNGEPAKPDVYVWKAQG